MSFKVKFSRNLYISGLKVESRIISQIIASNSVLGIKDFQVLDKVTGQDIKSFLHEDQLIEIEQDSLKLAHETYYGELE